MESVCLGQCEKAHNGDDISTVWLKQWMHTSLQNVLDFMMQIHILSKTAREDCQQ